MKQLDLALTALVKEQKIIPPTRVGANNRKDTLIEAHKKADKALKDLVAEIRFLFRGTPSPRLRQIFRDIGFITRIP